MTPEVNQTKTRLSQAFLWRTISFFWDYFCWLIKFHLYLWNFCLTSTLWCKKKVSTQWLGPAMIHSFCCLKIFVISDEFSIVRGNYLILLHCLITANNENVCQSCYIFDGMRWNCFFKRLSLKSVSKKILFQDLSLAAAKVLRNFDASSELRQKVQRAINFCVLSHLIVLGFKSHTHDRLQH